MDVEDDRCEIFVYGVQCIKRKQTKRYCERHASADIKRETVKQECCICYDTIADGNIIRFSCLHVVCSNCFGKFRSFLCPMCKTNLTDELSPEMLALIKSRQEDDGMDRVRDFIREENNNSRQVTILSTDIPEGLVSVVELFNNSFPFPQGDIYNGDFVDSPPRQQNRGRGRGRGNRGSNRGGGNRRRSNEIEEQQMTVSDLIPLIINGLMGNRHQEPPVVRRNEPNRGRGRGGRIM